MRKRVRMAAGAGLTLVLAGLMAGTASAAQLDIETDEGDYFTKRFSVYADDPIAVNPTVMTQQWTLKKQGSTIRQTRHAQWTLAPGTYKAVFRAKPKMRSTITLGQWDTYCKIRNATSTVVPGVGWHSTGTVRCTDPKTKMTYSGPFDVTNEENYSLPFADSDGLPRNLILNLEGTPTKFVRTYDVTVKANNGSWISSAEAKAVKVGMPKDQVHRIFGAKGRQKMVAPGFEVRFYEGGDIVIGYVNGKVNSIQRM